MYRSRPPLCSICVDRIVVTGADLVAVRITRIVAARPLPPVSAEAASASGGPASRTSDPDGVSGGLGSPGPVLQSGRTDEQCSASLMRSPRALTRQSERHSDSTSSSRSMRCRRPNGAPSATRAASGVGPKPASRYQPADTTVSVVARCFVGESLGEESLGEESLDGERGASTHRVIAHQAIEAIQSDSLTFSKLPSSAISTPSPSPSSMTEGASGLRILVTRTLPLCT